MNGAHGYLANVQRNAAEAKEMTQGSKKSKQLMEAENAQGFLRSRRIVIFKSVQVLFLSIVERG